MSHASLHQLASAEAVRVQVVSAFYHLCCLGKLLGCHLRNLDAIFHPVVVFLESSQSLDVLRIIRIVVDNIGCGKTVEAFDKHSLTIHIGKTKWSYHFGHSMFTAKLLHRLQQGTRHILVVNEVEPSEANLLLLPLFVGAMIDDGSHSSHHLSSSQGQVILRLTELEGRVSFLRQSVLFIESDERNSILIIFIQVAVKTDKSIQVFLTAHLPYFYLIAL